MLKTSTGLPFADFAEQLRSRRPELAAVADSVGAQLRVGVRHPRDEESLTDDERTPGSIQRETIDGAVEVSVAEQRLDELSARAGELGSVLADLSDTQKSIITLGVMHHVIEPRQGEVFLSLTFRRAPGTTLDQLHEWWLNQHAAIAMSFMLPETLAYDQVHVDHQLSEQASLAAGFAYRRYDSYDNLTWANYGEVFKSIDKPGAAEALYEDEVGHIDHSTYVGSIMAVV
jgi:hypothetical protein